MPDLAQITKPIRDLLRKDTEFVWHPQQQEAFNIIKQKLTTAPTLAYYNVDKKVRVSADASSYGLGAVLEQEVDHEQWRPVAYASRSMSDTETRYAQIEKEALAIAWSCERFEQYLLGRTFHIHTDHLPLLAILGSKSLVDLSPRLQRLRIRLMRYDYTISHVPGKLLYTADALSRAPASGLPSAGDKMLEDEIQSFVDQVVHNLPVSDVRLQEIIREQRTDPIFNKVCEYIHHGWPEKHNLHQECMPFFK